MTDYWDNIPIEVRRENYGWFGEPWPSGTCEKTNEEGQSTGEWNWEMQKQTPVGEECIDCGEAFTTEDQGVATPVMDVDRTWIGHTHKECRFRAVVGPLAHLERRCRCFGGTDHESPGLTRRQEAIAVWNHYTTLGEQ